MQSQFIPFDKAVHHYLQPVTEMTVIEQVLECHYAQKPWALAGGKVNWHDHIAPPLEEWDQHIQKHIAEAYQEQAQSYVRAKCEEAIQTISGNATPFQLAFWVEKATRAKALLTQNLSEDEKSILQEECQARERQETPEELAQKQLNKSTELARKMAKLEGMEKATRDRLKHANLPEDLNCILHEFNQTLASQF